MVVENLEIKELNEKVYPWGVQFIGGEFKSFKDLSSEDITNILVEHKMLRFKLQLLHQSVDNDCTILEFEKYIKDHHKGHKSIGCFSKFIKKKHEAK